MLKGKSALVTGSTSGIGLGMAQALAAQGANVMLNGFGREDEIAGLRARLERDHGVEVAYSGADMSQPAQIREMVAQTIQKFGAVDILVNAVGGSTIIGKSGATVDELSFTDWQRLIDFNLSGTFLFTHAVVPVMKAQTSGKIVNPSSIAGRGLNISSSSAYAAAKGGIIAFTRKLAFELGPYGININAIAPSRTLTERIRPRWDQSSPEDQQAEIGRTPLRRIAEAVDQAKVICFWHPATPIL